MRILLTNDDGFSASGLQTLYQVFSQRQQFVVNIVAPDSQRSASGHAITLFEPLFVVEHKLSNGQAGFSVRGTPSDCVKLALEGKIIPKPDLIISGINLGPNLGTDIFYSGTVSAAMEGVIAGIPAIAASLASFEYHDFLPAAEWLAEYVASNGEQHKQGLININFPGFPSQNWQGTHWARLGKAIYQNVFEGRVDPRGRKYYWQGGTLGPETNGDTDIALLRKGYITLTPLHADLTDYKKLGELSGAEKDECLSE